MKLMFFIFLFSLSLYGQNKKFDSLREVIKTTKIDTVKVKALSRFAFNFSRIDPDTAISVANEALAITRKKNLVLLEARILHDLASYYYILGKYDTAMKINYNSISCFEKAEKLATDDLKLKSVLSSKAKTIANIGDIYSRLGDYQRAIEFHKKSLLITVKIKDTIFQANSYKGLGLAYAKSANYVKALEAYFAGLKLVSLGKRKNIEPALLDGIGTVYSDQGDFDKALDYYLKSLQAKIELKDDRGLASIYGNIAGAYYHKQQYSLALMYLNRSNKIAIETKDKRVMVTNMIAIGSIYQDQGDSLSNAKNSAEAKIKYGSALKCFENSLAIAEEMKSKSMIAILNGDIGVLYNIQKQNKKAKAYVIKASDLSNEIGDLDGVMQYNQLLSMIYEDEKDFPNSLVHFKKYIVARDSINNEENTKKQVQAEMNFEFDKKESVNRAAQEKKAALVNAESKRQKIVIWSICSVLTLTLLFAGFVYRNFLQKQKINIEISYQKKIIEEKQKEVLDSIYYARRIQRALITSETYIQNNIRRLLGKNN